MQLSFSSFTCSTSWGWMKFIKANDIAFWFDLIGAEYKRYRISVKRDSQVTLRKASASGAVPSLLLGRHLYQPVSSLCTSSMTRAPSGSTSTRRNGCVSWTTSFTSTLFSDQWTVTLSGYPPAWHSNLTLLPSSAVVFCGGTIMYTLPASHHTLTVVVV